jgi:hypothetical protein
VFPYAVGGPYGDWTASAAGWTALGLLTAGLLGLVLVREGSGRT